MATGRNTTRKPARSTSGQASRKKKSGAAAKSGRMPVAWGVTGLAIGLMVALVVHLEHRRPDTTGGDETPASDEETASESDQPRFEFYRLLNEQEVEVAEEQAPRDNGTQALPEADPPPESSTDSDSAPPSDEDKRYLLQAGSFRQAEDADSLKASLALLGIQARIQVVELSGGETWHRVRIGPFNDLEQVNGVRTRMADQEIESILLQAGG
ncbi:SPOR domain-containing protein [Spiribacter vilamensis]|uniref:Sporulation related protein n=1 Tax=Spiribacter vilamensis TaxID=531306 RepID=A0A4Q8D1Z1_9GAMM|nr:SPOR domain-containing protein [Spiribacter vilamensis]RZU99297.1 sporulation related protein [Spiribacter vilamensis]TVO61719.1 SPOR domain-containing protein [Spiribacter vilamensis]